MSVAPIAAVILHTKARQKVYPGSNGMERFPVPDEKVSWSESFPEYNPTDYTHEIVASHPVWADPEVRNNTGEHLKFNQRDGKINRKSHIGKYDVLNGVPRNPVGRTGMIGRGLLGKWGPNHAADPIVTRWKRDPHDNIVKDSETQNGILQFVSIKRKDTGEWAIPGGMVDSGDTVSATLKREFGEEAMNSMEAPDSEKKVIEKAVSELFKCGREVYRGYVDDPRNTDNAWMETVAVNFHDMTGNSVGKFKLHAGDDAGDVQWTDISSKLKLFASHEKFIQQTAKMQNAHW
ncbi:ADP-ribose pyrophosphatase, mitochondrial-like [Glandiceps talaboti]